MQVFSKHPGSRITYNLPTFRNLPHSAILSTRTMADFIKNPVVSLPDQQPAPHDCGRRSWCLPKRRRQRIADVRRSSYPTADGAVMRALWLAQEKFGFLPPEVIRLTADAARVCPYAQVVWGGDFLHAVLQGKARGHLRARCLHLLLMPGLRRLRRACIISKRSSASTRARRPRTACLRCRRLNASVRLRLGSDAASDQRPLRSITSPARKSDRVD